MNVQMRQYGGVGDEHMTEVFERIRGIRRKQYTGRERNTEYVKKEDFLIKQIDEFKEKARQLQQLLEIKEARVQELTHVVEEREQKAENLQNVLQEKQQEAGRITKGIQEQTRQLAGSLEGQLAQIEKDMEDGLEQVSVKVDARLEQQKTAMDGLIGQLDTMKGELSEKIHTENVKSYRNMQSLIEELEKKLDTAEEKKNKFVTCYLRAAVILGILNLLAVAGFFMYEAGILNYFL